jgi:hypothetical protein
MDIPEWLQQKMLSELGLPALAFSEFGTVSLILHSDGGLWHETYGSKAKRIRTVEQSAAFSFLQAIAENFERQFSSLHPILECDDLIQGFNFTALHPPVVNGPTFAFVNSLNAITAVLKSKKNLTRFTYETKAFQGWRLCISRNGTTFTKYFSDNKFGSGQKSLAAAEKALSELKALFVASKLVNGKLTAATVKKAEKLLAEA